MVTSYQALAAASLVGLFVLAACNSEPETVTNRLPDPQAEVLQNVAPVELPPSIQAARTYRCKDNSLVYIDFYTNNTARVRAERGGESTTLTAEAGNPPYLAEGYSVSANADQIDYTSPGGGTQSCKA